MSTTPHTSLSKARFGGSTHPALFKHSTLIIRSFCLSLIFCISGWMMSGCMRIDPDHPYDLETPLKDQNTAYFEANLILESQSVEFDYSVFHLTLTLRDSQFTDLEDDVYVKSKQSSSDGKVIFKGIFPGTYILSIFGVIDGRLYGVDDQEVFLPTGQSLNRPFVLKALTGVN